jgi:hypothetical protein
MLVWRARLWSVFSSDYCQKLFDPSAHLGDNPEAFYQIGR